MKNQNNVDDHRLNVSRFDNLYKRKMYHDALAAAEKCLDALQVSDHVDKISKDVVTALKLIDGSRSALHELELKFSELSSIMEQLCRSAHQKDEEVIKTLTGWLDNVQKIKNGWGNP